MPYDTVNPSAAAANGTVIAAPGSDYKITIDSVFVSSDTQQVITLHSAGASGTADIFKQYVAADGGANQAARGSLQASNGGDEIQYTTSASGNAFIALSWHHEEA